MSKYMTKREATRKRAWFRAIAGLMDFFASVGSFIVILLCVALLAQLFVWLKTDITQTLHSIESVAADAIVQPEQMPEIQQLMAQPTPVPAAADVSSQEAGGAANEEANEDDEAGESTNEEGESQESNAEDSEHTGEDDISDYYGDEEE